MVVDKVLSILGATALEEVHNHHNYAWREQHAGESFWVVRKGATPARPGQRGFVGSTMGEPSVILEGVESDRSADALYSTVHGAGRAMSRTAAREKFRWNHIKPMLAERGVKLLSAGIDENPFVYKDIHEVMRSQADLVEVVARFDPRIVRMAGDGERPED